MESVATGNRRNELQEAGVPPKAARPLARMCITLGQLMRKDLVWAVACLAEKEVTLSYREEEQLEMAITPAAAGNGRANRNVPLSAQTPSEQPQQAAPAAPRPKPLYYHVPYVCDR